MFHHVRIEGITQNVRPPLQKTEASTHPSVSYILPPSLLHPSLPMMLSSTPTYPPSDSSKAHSPHICSSPSTSRPPCSARGLSARDLDSPRGSGFRCARHYDPLSAVRMSSSTGLAVIGLAVACVLAAAVVRARVVRALRGRLRWSVLRSSRRRRRLRRK